MFQKRGFTTMPYKNHFWVPKQSFGYQKPFFPLSVKNNKEPLVQ